MEARSAVVLRDLFADPRSPRCPGTRRPGAAPDRAGARPLPACRWSLAAGVVVPRGRPPPHRPAAAPALPAFPRPRRAPRRPSGWTARPRRSRAAVPVLPRERPGLRGRLPHARRSRAGWRAATWTTCTMDAVLRALPHNVTTEMDLQLWALAQRVRADPASAAALLRRRAPTPSLAARFRAGDLPAGPAGRARGVPAPLRPPGRRRDRPRHAALVRAARRTCSACWPTTCGWTTRPPHPTPGSPPASGTARGGGRRVGRAGPAALPVARAGRRVRPRPGAGAGRAARGAQGPPRPADRARPGRARGASAPSWPRGACSTHPTTSSSSTCPRSRRRSAAPTCAARGRRAARGVRAGAAPPARAAGAALRRHRARGARRRRRPPDEARCVGTPASAGTVTGDGPRRPRPGRRAAGARRDPRRAVHRSRLDAAVPHRRRAGDGDGRGQLARRRRGPRVRHPGRRGRPGRHHRIATGPG